MSRALAFAVFATAIAATVAIVIGPAAPPATASAADGPVVFAIGDSNMVRASIWPWRDLRSEVPGIEVDAVDNRNFSAATQILADRLAAGPAPDVLVVALGTNGPVLDMDVADLMAVAGPIRDVMFVNVRVPRSWEGQVNGALGNAVAKYDKALLADWHLTSEGHPEYLLDDGFHISGAGSAAWSELIARTIDEFPPPFIDIGDTVFAEDIVWLRYRGITKGCNPPLNDAFCPEDRVTRGQMAAFLVRALGLTEGAGSNGFVDDDGSIFEADIERLAASGITKGCNPPTNNRFCPEDRLTRGQMAAFLRRAIG